MADEFRSALDILCLVHFLFGDTLEPDALFLNAERIEIPTSITAVEFYRKKGYDYKNGIRELDDEQHYRLEKFRKMYRAIFSGKKSVLL